MSYSVPPPVPVSPAAPDTALARAARVAVGGGAAALVAAAALAVGLGTVPRPAAPSTRYVPAGSAVAQPAGSSSSQPTGAPAPAAAPAQSAPVVATGGSGG